MASSLATRCSSTAFQLQWQTAKTNPSSDLSSPQAFFGKRICQHPARHGRNAVGHEAEWRSHEIICMATEGRELVGEDFGARDPFDAEIASDFGNKVLGDADTEHKIKIPILRGIVGLSARNCQKLGPDTKALSADEANNLRKQILGWKLLEGPDGTLRLRREWELRNFQAGLDLIERISKLAEEQKHHPDLHLTGWNKAAVDLYSHELGGLSENDFILAAKIEEINTADLIKKVKKFWA